MCEFFSGIIDRYGKCYTLGEIVAHEQIIKKYKLKDGHSQHMARWEIAPKRTHDYLKTVGETNWRFKLDEDIKPSWWSGRMEEKCWKFTVNWFKSKEGKAFVVKFKRFKKLNAENEKKAKMSGE